MTNTIEKCVAADQIRDVPISLPEGATVRAIKSFADGMILSGDVASMHAGWARRFDKQGKVKWEFITPGEYNIGPVGSYINDATNFNNGNTILCGRTGRIEGKGNAAFIKFLSPSGKAIREIRPREGISDQYKIPEIHYCFPREDGSLLSVGSVVARGEKKIDHYLWIAEWNAKGEILVEKFHRAESNLQEFSVMRTSTIGKYIVAAGGPMQTEVFALSADGSLSNRFVLPKEYIGLEMPAVSTSTFLVAKRSDGKGEIIEFDANINIKAKTKLSLPQNAIFKFAWQTPRKDAYYFFGNVVRHGRSSEVAVWRISNGAVTMLTNFSDNQSLLLDAVVYDPNSSEFLIARSLTLGGQYSIAISCIKVN